MYQDLILNTSLLVALTTLYNLLARARAGGNRWIKITSGLLFGGVAVAGMIAPFHYGPGIIYDGRSIVLAMAGLFGGGTATLVAMAVAGTYRAILGGNGVWAGIATIASCALLGLTFRRLAGNRPSKLELPALYGIGISVHLAMLASQLLIVPWPAGLTAIRGIWLPIMLLFPVATVLMGVLLRTEDRRLEAETALRESEARHRTILHTAMDGFWRVDRQGHLRQVNAAYCQMSGYSEQELVGKDIARLEAVEQPADTNARVQKIMAQGEGRFETRHIRKDGSSFAVEICIRYLPEQENSFFRLST